MESVIALRPRAIGKVSFGSGSALRGQQRQQKVEFWPPLAKQAAAEMTMREIAAAARRPHFSAF